MRVTALIRFEATPQQVFAMLLDREFQDLKMRETGALHWEVSVTGDDAGAVIRTRRELPTDRVPEPFKGAVGASLALEQVETWGPAAADGSRTGELDVHAHGTPIRFTGTLRLTPTSTGAQQLVEGELKAKVPLVGGRIERATEPAVRAAIEAEERIGKGWLESRR